MKKKRANLSLIELMVCLVIISLVGIVLFRNVGRSLDEGKAFRSVEGAKQICYVLNMESVVQNKSSAELAADWEAIVLNSPYFGGGKAALKDGWGNTFEVGFSAANGFQVRSRAYEQHVVTKGQDVNEYWI